MLKLTKAKGSDEELAQKFDETQRKYCRFLMERLPEWVKDNVVKPSESPGNTTRFFEPLPKAT